MTKANIKSKQGFTIIEVVLVLAIAGLIFLMVFVALPAMQRSQKNTQRKNDMSRLTAAINEYQGNNGNRVPDPGDSSFIESYVGNFSGPNNEYTFEDETCDSSGCTEITLNSGDDKIAWYINAICSGNDSTSTDASDVVQPASTTTPMMRKLAFVVKMDSNTDVNGSLYCVSN